MKNLKKLLVLAIVVAFASCATNNDVVSNGLFQKRKYLKGVYFEKSGAKGFDKKEVIEDEIAEVENDENSESNGFNSFETNVEDETNLPDELTSIEASEDLEFIETEELESETNSISDKFSPIINNREVKDVRRKLDKKPLSVRKSVESSAAAESGAMLILLIILCFIIPPLAIFIYSGTTTWFWIDLILYLLAVGFLGLGILGGLGGAGFAAFLIALLVILDLI